MSIRPIYLRCQNCGTRWSFNPDAGRIHCPTCLCMPQDLTDKPASPYEWLANALRNAGKKGKTDFFDD